MKTSWSWGWLVGSESLHHRAPKGGIFFIFYLPPAAGVKIHPITGGGQKIGRHVVGKTRWGVLIVLKSAKTWRVFVRNLESNWATFPRICLIRGYISSRSDLFLVFFSVICISILCLSAQLCFYRRMHRCVGAARGGKNTIGPHVMSQHRL